MSTTNYLIIVFILLNIMQGQEAVPGDSHAVITEPGPTEAYDATERTVACIDMVKADSDLIFEQNGETRALCGVYFIGDIDDVISLEIIDAKLNCDQGEFIEIIDGWMARGSILPNENDHTDAITSRIVDYCSWHRGKRDNAMTFTSSQNIALIQFRLYHGNGLNIRFRKLHQNKPKCHVVTPTSEGEYTMRSIRGRTCTFSIIHPTHLVVNEVKLGNTEDISNATGDTIEILNGESLDTTDMRVVYRFNSPLDFKEIKFFALDGSHSAVRMTSSGFNDNVIKFKYSRISEETLKAELCT